MIRVDAPSDDADAAASATDLSLTEMEVVELDDEVPSAEPKRATGGPPQRRPPPRSKRTSGDGPKAAIADEESEIARPATSAADVPDKKVMAEASAELESDETRLARAAGVLAAPPADGADARAKLASANYPTPHWAGQVLAQDDDGVTRRVLRIKEDATADSEALDGFKAGGAQAGEQLGERHCDSLAVSSKGGVLELKSGGHGLPSLREAMLSGPLALDRACGVLKQVATAFGILDKQGLEHGALTADAVLIGDDDTINLTDFGIAKLVDLEADAFANEFAPHLPETAVGMPAERADIYGFGCVAFFVLTGRPLFREGGNSDRGQQRRRHAIEEPDLLKRDGRLLHKKLNAFVQRCLEKEPSDRFEDFGELATALAAALTAAEISTEFDELPVETGARTFDSRDAPKTAGAIVARGTDSGSALAPVEQTSMRVAGASVIAPIAEVNAAAGPDAAAAPAKLPSSDEKGLEEFELGKAHIDWPIESRRLRQIAIIGGASIFIILGLGSLSDYMSERAAERDAKEQATLARGDLPARWMDPNIGASTTGTLEVMFAEGTAPPYEDPTTAGDAAEVAETSTTGTADETTGTADETTGTADETTGTADETTGTADETTGTADETPAEDPALTPAPTGDPTQLAKQAASALRNGNRSKAISLYKEALSIDSRHIASLIALSDIYFDSGSYNTAARYLRRLTSLRSSTGKYRLLLGDAYYKSGAYAKAVTQYEKAMSLGVSGADRRLAKAQSKL